MELNTVTTIASVPAILALVNLGKRFGLSGAWSALVAVLLGVGLALANFYGGNNPAFQAAAQGLIMGLGAAGLWDFGKTVSPTQVIETPMDSAPLPDGPRPVTDADVDALFNDAAAPKHAESEAA